MVIMAMLRLLSKKLSRVSTYYLFTFIVVWIAVGRFMDLLFEQQHGSNTQRHGSVGWSSGLENVDLDEDESPSGRQYITPKYYQAFMDAVKAWHARKKTRKSIFHTTWRNPRIPSSYIKRTDVVPKNAKEFEELEGFLKLAFLVNATNEENLLLENDGRVLDDPYVISNIRTVIGDDIRKSAKRHMPSKEVKGKTISSFQLHGNSISIAPLISRIFEKHFKNSFHGKTFIQVGTKSTEYCWEAAIRKMDLRATWSGLVVELYPVAMDIEMVTRLAPVCVSTSKRVELQVLKRVGWAVKANRTHSDRSRARLKHGKQRPVYITKARASIESKAIRMPSNRQTYTNTGQATEPDHHPKNSTLYEFAIFEPTLLPVPEVEAFVNATNQKRWEVLNLRPMICFPLYSIMVAANVLEVDYLSISTTGYAGKIAETLPWDKVEPQVIHLADIGYDQSAKRLLESKEYTLDQELYHPNPHNHTTGDFVFYKTP